MLRVACGSLLTSLPIINIDEILLIMSGSGRGRYRTGNKRPAMTATRVRQIAEVTEHKVADNAKFSEVETVLSLRAAGWDGSQQPVTIVRHFQDYVPFSFAINHVTVITPCSVYGGAVRAGTTYVLFALAKDVAVDVNLTSWGFRRAPPKEKALNNPWFECQKRVITSRAEYIEAVEQFTNSSLHGDQCELSKKLSQAVTLELRLSNIMLRYVELC